MSKLGSDDDLLAEYDFATMKPLPKGRFAPEREGMRIAVLAPDVASAFPSHEELNAALRLILRLRDVSLAGPAPV